MAFNHVVVGSIPTDGDLIIIFFTFVIPPAAPILFLSLSRLYNRRSKTQNPKIMN